MPIINIENISECQVIIFIMRQEQSMDLKGVCEISVGQQRKRYGKLKVFSWEKIHVSIGPNYSQFVMGFSMLIFMGIFLTYFILANIESKLHRNVSVLFAVVTPILYLLTALSDPGVYRPQKYASNKKIRYCHTCMHFIPKSVQHCQKCEICIQNYDHHCPFMSKCIGRGNIICFYLFISFVSLYSLLMYYSLYVGIWGHHDQSQ